MREIPCLVCGCLIPLGKWRRHVKDEKAKYGAQIYRLLRAKAILDPNSRPTVLPVSNTAQPSLFQYGLSFGKRSRQLSLF